MIKIKFHVSLRPMWSMRILFLLSLAFSFGSFLSEEIIGDEDEGTQYTGGIVDEEGRQFDDEDEDEDKGIYLITKCLW